MIPIFFNRRIGSIFQLQNQTEMTQVEFYKKIKLQAMLRFWQAKDQWVPSWRGPNAYKSKLQVDYVRVWAI